MRDQRSDKKLTAGCLSVSLQSAYSWPGCRWVTFGLGWFAFSKAWALCAVGRRSKRRNRTMKIKACDSCFWRSPPQGKLHCKVANQVDVCDNWEHEPHPLSGFYVNKSTGNCTLYNGRDMPHGGVPNYLTLAEDMTTQEWVDVIYLWRHRSATEHHSRNEKGTTHESRNSNSKNPSAESSRFLALALRRPAAALPEENPA